MGAAADEKPLSEEKPLPPPSKPSNVIITDHQLGVWKLRIATTSGGRITQFREEFTTAIPILQRIGVDIYHIAPGLAVTFLLCQIWRGIEDALTMHLTSSLLRIIEKGILTGQPDVNAIAYASILRVLCSLFIAYLAWTSDKIIRKLQREITSHFEMYLMKARLRVDLPTSQEATSKQEADAGSAFNSLRQILYFLTELLSAVSHIALIVNLSRTSGGPLFALICVIKPLSQALFSRNLWNKVCFGYVNNSDHKRMKAMQALSRQEFRQDVITGNLGEWITAEYEKASQALDNLPSDHPFSIYGRRESPFFSILLKLLGDAPMLYCATCAIFTPSRFSIASIAILQQSAHTLRWTLETLFNSTEYFRRSLSDIKNLYAAEKIINILHDGQLAYPQVDEKGKCETGGMSFELRDVSFSYPGSQKTSPALKNISLSIKSGQIIVIVGSNGSGKSTLVRILSRLYDPSSGQVLIGGRPCGEYKMQNLHQATAILSQDNTIYPLSLGENIALGSPVHFQDAAMIEQAAKDGGAWEFITKLKEGLETVLDPLAETFSCNLYGDKGHPLYEDMENADKKIDISGGERQRVVAARTFMRFNSGSVNFVAVDEPSSALDAEGELQLFERLISARKGKTMVFVTHRFGHLTKYADQIICMKDGLVAEIGSHEDLLAKDGDYAKLYNIQANAFVTPDGSASETSST